MNKYLILAVFTATFIFQSASLFAQINSISFGTELLGGDSTYQIGGNCEPAIACVGYDGHFPLSELKFPMDMLLATARLQANFDKLNVDLQLKKSVISTTATFKDSDWITNAAPNQLDIYSESDSSVDAFIIDASMDMNFLTLSTTMNNYLGVGYILQDLYFKARNTVQEYPSNPSKAVITIPGLTITYQIDYSILYLYYRAHYRFSSDTIINIKLGYSPSVSITDIDNHVLRNLTFRGDLNGTANIAELSLDYQFSTDTKLNFSYRFMNVSADGSQRQFRNGIYNATIAEKITSTQNSLALRYYYRF